MGCLHEIFFIDFTLDSCSTHKISEHVFLDFSKNANLKKKEIYEFPYKKQVFLWCKVQNFNIQD
jgi:hypothetical protein